MSLKAFHIIFIAVSIAIAIGFGFWCLNAYFEQHGLLYALTAGISFIISGVLFVYGIWFLRKLKHVSFM